MTALNIILGPSKGYVLTDTFLYSPAGDPVSFGRKCAIAEEARVVVACRADPRLSSELAERIDATYGSIDDIVADEAFALADAYEATLASFEVVHTHVQICLAGWSIEAGRPIGAFLSLDDDGWHFDSIEEADGGPVPGEAQMGELRLIGAEPGVDWTAETFDPIRHGVPLLEAQRRMKCEANAGSGEKIHAVGGEIVLATITRDGIAQEVIHQWPDVEGQPVKPEPFVRPLAPNANRQQRRAAERAARKARRAA